HGADLDERAVTASVGDGRPRFEAADAEDVEREVEHEVRALLEHAGSPERRAYREAPFGQIEAGIQLTNLEDPDGRVETRQRDGEADILSRRPLMVRPRDEALEALDIGRRRRDEAGNFLRGQ